MKFHSSLAAVVLTAWTSVASAQLPAVVGETPVPSLAPMLKRVSPAVVNIATRGTVQEQNPLLNDPFFRRFFDVPNTPRQREFQSAGSGVIVDSKNGYIITNAHVVENATEITVQLLDNRSLTAKVIGKDPGSDVAVLKVHGRQSRWTFRSRTATRPKSATSSWRSATRLASATRSPRASSVRSAAPASIPKATKTSSRPMRRSTRAIRAAHS